MLASNTPGLGREINSALLTSFIMKSGIQERRRGRGKEEGKKNQNQNQMNLKNDFCCFFLCSFLFFFSKRSRPAWDFLCKNNLISFFSNNFVEFVVFSIFFDFFCVFFSFNSTLTFFSRFGDAPPTKSSMTTAVVLRCRLPLPV